MVMQPVTIRLPADLYARLREQATYARRTVEDEVIEVLGSALTADDELPPDLTAAVAGLAVLDDEALWQMAHGRRLTEVAQELERLHLKRADEGLTEAERESAATLVRQYDQLMLVRAHALLLLKQCGRDVGELMQPS